MKTAIIAAGVLALGLMACGPKASETAATSAAPAASCAADAATTWTAAAGVTLKLTGTFAGADCAKGDAVLSMKDDSGAELYKFSLPVDVTANTVFAEAKTQATMQKALADWIDPNSNTTMQMTSALPAWAAKEEAPGNAEFPFMPDVSRADYAKLREANVPLYCHVQGGESLACVVLDQATHKVTQVGLQRFPG